jgi:hypothetical protein
VSLREKEREICLFRVRNEEGRKEMERAEAEECRTESHMCVLNYKLILLSKFTLKITFCSVVIDTELVRRIMI